MLRCTGGNLTLFQDTQCWSGAHIIHAVFAILISVIFVVISMVVSLTYF